jgi:hypothetical protein
MNYIIGLCGYAEIKRNKSFLVVLTGQTSNHARMWHINQLYDRYGI